MSSKGFVTAPGQFRTFISGIVIYKQWSDRLMFFTRGWSNVIKCFHIGLLQKSDETFSINWLLGAKVKSWATYWFTEDPPTLCYRGFTIFNCEFQFFISVTEMHRHHAQLTRSLHYWTFSWQLFPFRCPNGRIFYEPGQGVMFR